MKKLKRVNFAIIAFLFMVSTSYAVNEKTIQERLTLLEAQKVQIEQAYIGILARIEELRELLNPKEVGDESNSSNGIDKPNGK